MKAILGGFVLVMLTYGIYAFDLTPYWWVWLLGMIVGYGLGFIIAQRNEDEILLPFQIAWTAGTCSLIGLMLTGLVKVATLVGI